MVARHYYRDHTGDPVEISDRIGRVDWELREQAEEGSTPMSTVVIDDPDMDFDAVGHRRYYVIEDESTGTDDVLFWGYTADQEVARGGGEWENPLGRIWTVSVTDTNAFWQRRIMVGEDCDRPAETDVERVQWLLATGEASLFDNVTTFVSTDAPVDMDAADYRYQGLAGIMDDCSQQSGKNWYSLVRKTGGVYEFSVWYGKDDLAGYDSALSLSNDPDDWTDATLADGSSLVWPISMDTKLRRDPGRVFSGVCVPFDGGTVYKQKEATATAFARRDTTMPAINVKTKAKADARANRYLNDLDEQDETITTAVELPATIATGIRAGMMVPFKATHLSGYTDFVNCRVLACTVTPLAAGERYRLSLELAPPKGSGSTGPIGALDAVLYVGHGPYTGGSAPIYFPTSGDNPGPGFLARPTSAFLTKLIDATPPKADYPLYGWELAGDGTVDIRFRASTRGVLIDDISFTVTWSILVNGVAVATETEVVAGFLEFYAGFGIVEATGVAVSTGDIITASLTCDPPTMPFFGAPRGTGQSDEWLEVFGGSLS